MKVMITGADGFLGSNLIRELIKRSYEVRACLEPGRDGKTIQELDIEIVRCDILNPDDLYPAVTDCQVVIHTAASTSTWPSRSPGLSRINLDGTANVVRACRKAGVERMIHVGTANSFGFGSKENPGNEKNPFTAYKYGLGYIDTKYEAHKTIMEEVKKNSFPAVVVNPTFMFGPYDSKPGSGSMILAIYHRQVPACSSGGRNFISVKDAACGIANAIEKGETGQAYILGNENLSYREIFAKIAAVVKVPPPRIVLPSFLTKAYGLMGSLKGAIFGRQPKISYPMARIACDTHFFSAQKAVNAIGLPQTPIEVAIREAFEWFRENGYLENS